MISQKVIIMRVGMKEPRTMVGDQSMIKL